MSRSRAALLLSLLAAPALAGPPDDVVRLEILPGWETADGGRMAGLRIVLAPGWKTYWRAPGEAGIPPMFDWTGSEGIAGARIHWPVPDVWESNGLRSIGYHDEVVIPLELLPRPGETPRRLAGTVDIGVCEEICMPVRLAFETDLADGGGRDPAIVAALVDRPATAAEAGVRDVVCRVEPTDRGLALEARIAMPPLDGREEVAIEAADPGLWVSEPDAGWDGGHLVARAEVQGGGVALDRSGLRITVIGGGSAVDIRGCSAG